MWLAVALGTLGSLLVTLDGSSASLGSSSAAVASTGYVGELLILLACCAYSCATVRLGLYAPMFVPINLAAVKKATLGSLSLMWLLADSVGEVHVGEVHVGGMLSWSTWVAYNVRVGHCSVWVCACVESCALSWGGGGLLVASV